MESIEFKNKTLKFLDRCKENLINTDPPMFCNLCGEIKKEFRNPKGFAYYKNGIRFVSTEAERIMVLKCSCEKEFEVLKDWYKYNVEINNKDYQAWLNGARVDEKRGHFKAMFDAKTEIDRINNILRTRN